MIDVWHTLESAFPMILAPMRKAEAESPEHPIKAIDNWGHLMDFLIFEGQPINGKIVTETLSRRAYMNPVALDVMYDSLVASGYAQKHDDGTFTITDKGRDAYLDYFAQRNASYEDVEVLPQADFERLLAFLQKGYEMAKHADEPDDKPSMSLGHTFYTGVAESGGQLGALLGWINLFELYRDDVHAFIWRDAGFTGIRMEVFTHVWHDDEHNAQKLAEHLSFRGYGEADYQAALDELVQFGLVTMHDNYYTLTEEGREFRNSIEESTNMMFQDFCMMTYSEEELAEFGRIIGVLKATQSE